MRDSHCTTVSQLSFRWRWLVLWLAAAPAALAVLGCGAKPEDTHTGAAPAPTVHLVHPTSRKIVRVVGQPSFIEAYERTSIFPKVTGYIEKWIVDIGDKVKKGDVLATLFVPEVVEDFGTKTATVEFDKQRIELALAVVQVEEAEVVAADTPGSPRPRRTWPNTRQTSTAGNQKSLGLRVRSKGASSPPRYSLSRKTS